MGLGFCATRMQKAAKSQFGFPEHSFKTIMNFIEIGFDNKEPINFEGKKIAPVNFLTQVLKRI